MSLAPKETLLLIEDDETPALLATTRARRNPVLGKYPVTRATSLEAALKILSDPTYDVKAIISDNSFPIDTGGKGMGTRRDNPDEPLGGSGTMLVSIIRHGKGVPRDPLQNTLAQLHSAIPPKYKDIPILVTTGTTTPDKIGLLTEAEHHNGYKPLDISISGDHVYTIPGIDSKPSKTSICQKPLQQAAIDLLATQVEARQRNWTAREETRTASQPTEIGI